jgi:very-short-patch-repair endonuclease
MKSAPASSVSAHGLFALWEKDAQGHPGLLVNPDAAVEDDERWLVIQRLQQSAPPPVKDALLQPWVDVTQAPSPAPKLKPVVSGADLIAAGTHREQGVDSSLSEAQRKRPEIELRAIVHLAEYDAAAHVRQAFSNYVSRLWTPWAEHEKAVREIISLYSKLFTLKQQFEEGIVEQALELVWGVGIGLWDQGSTALSYPLITRLVELNLDDATGAIEIRPRDLPPRLELDWYASLDNPGVTAVEKAGKEFFQGATVTVSPFDRGSFEPLLRSAVTHLDPNGTYRPDQVAPEDRSVPKSTPNLVVTDTWVLFARPRSTNLFIQDLERFKQRVEAEPSLSLPHAVNAVVSDPATTNTDVALPEFRGVSMSGGHGSDGVTAGRSKPRDLFFPKPFNDEQVRIAQLLEVSDGVVVQGPPGTGKTHTIANVISHFLANGKRVLVTSMKDPALGVLRDQLPAEIRPLAISLLSTEQDGMKQFEHAIHKIASEVQSIDRTALAREIGHLESAIDAMHGQIARLDYETAAWAKKNLEPIDLDGERIAPQDAAREVVQGAGTFEWLADSLDVSSRCAPKLADADIVRLREARRILGADIAYLGAVLPSHGEFPDAKRLTQVHEDLRRYQKLKDEVESGELPALVDSAPQTLEAAEALLVDIAALETKRSEIADARRPWTVAVHTHLVQNELAESYQMLALLGRDLAQEREAKKEFLKRPVELPPGFEMDAELTTAVSNLAQGQSPFGMRGVFGKTAQKQMLKRVRVLERTDLQDADAWQHVQKFLDYRRRLQQLAIQWNALAPETGLDPLPDTEPDHGLAALAQYQLFERVVAVVAAENAIASTAKKLLPAFEPVHKVMSDARATQRIADALHRHLTKHRLTDVWATKERFQVVLQDKNGAVVADLRRFLSETLGNPEIDALQMRARWTALMGELARIQALSNELAVVQDVTTRMAECGAPLWAEACRQPLATATDAVLPDNWRAAWRLRRLATHLDAIDAQQALKRLVSERAQHAHDLARAYENIVAKRTWLKLAENATPNIRTALAAYLTAIQKIGKGTGKRAVRYRKDARDAATAANPAVPCWIMPHHRVSESLPAEFGCFHLVVIDEASQSDLTALPALLRAEKVLIVGDHKQVSPDGVGLEEEKVRHLMSRYLGGQVPLYRPQLSPERSLYDLFKVVFQSSAVMLKEHFRCVAPIIEYSKREFYNHELKPLRIPRASERLDPPLIDVLIEDGYRSGDLNRPEAEFIVREIESLVRDEKMNKRTIGVVSLLADKQALHIWERLTDTLGPEVMRRHHIACGDARTFQGKERDVMFITMVTAPNDVGAALSRDTFAQRFNVAASRARDRVYLVRSVEPDQLSERDVLRRSLIAHFSTPFLQDEETVADLRARCESPFEREVYDELTRRGFRVNPQVKVGSYRIDLVVEGDNDARLAVECDGDQYHGADKWADDMKRQRVLERAGWVFWRCFASTFVRRRESVVGELVAALAERGIEPVDGQMATRSVHCQFRRVRMSAPPAGGTAADAKSAAEDEPAPPAADAPAAARARVPNGTRPAPANAPAPARAGEEEAPRFAERASAEAAALLERARAQAQHVAPTYSDEALRAFLDKHVLTSEDHRDNKGALWVHWHSASGAPARQLGAWGFQYKPGRGWWRK